MKNRIENISKKLFAGKCLEMSCINDQTMELWKSFMPLRNQVENRVDFHYYSMQLYSDTFNYDSFDPAAKFVKWAVVEVSNYDNIPNEMEHYTMEGGLYAVFTHVGPASSFSESMKYIHETWLPSSEYSIDNREHFEILEENYDPFDKEATEEIWIPIILRDKV